MKAKNKEKCTLYVKVLHGGVSNPSSPPDWPLRGRARWLPGDAALTSALCKTESKRKRFGYTQDKQAGR